MRLLEFVVNNYFRPTLALGGHRSAFEVFVFCDRDEASALDAWAAASAVFRGRPYTMVAYRAPPIDGPWTQGVRLVGIGRPVPPHWLEEVA